VREYGSVLLPAIEPMRWLRSLATFAALATALLLWAGGADASLESGSSFDRSAAGKFVTSRIAQSAPISAVALNNAEAAPPTRPGSLGDLFNRPGLLAGFAAGFLGAGLLGFLFGHGLFGGLNGVASFLGLFFQLALLAMLGRLIWTWWSGGNAPAFAGLSPRQQAEPYLRSRNESLPGIYPHAGADDAEVEGKMTSRDGSAKKPSSSDLKE
jgi:hypothetical protein